MKEDERIVCEFLRKIAPSREWEYLCEVEHCWIGELCDELNKQLKAENAKLIVKLNAEHIARQNVEIENAKLLRMLRALALCADDSADCDKCVMNGATYSSVRQTFCDGMADELRAVGIEVPS